MNEKTPPRRPATFKLDDPGVVVMDPEDSGRLTRGTIQIVPEAEPAQLPVPADTPLLPARRGFRWGTLFWSAVAGLVVLGSGLGVLNLIEDLFARNEGLGFLGLALAVVAAVALAVVTMRELVRNCLRMRPERIIVGEVRGPEAFDLLQAMNTGHDGSMGTLHANNPREALSRCESMITMGGFSLPSRTIREMICASVDIIVQAARLRDGSRRITHITEVMGMEGDTIITQDIFLYDVVGEDANGKIIGKHRSTGIGRPRFWERARYYNEEKRLAAALDASDSPAPA